MIGEWFPAKETGLAQGTYAGFGNFGSAAAGVTLPRIALAIGGDNGWRWALALTVVISIVYAGIYYVSVSNTPKRSTYFSPKEMGAMEVTSRSDFVLSASMQIPRVLALLAWTLGPANLGLLSASLTNLIYLALAGLYAYQIWDGVRINRPILSGLPVCHPCSATNSARWRFSASPISSRSVPSSRWCRLIRASFHTAIHSRLAPPVGFPGAPAIVFSGPAA